jgi:hypothetical protein
VPELVPLLIDPESAPIVSELEVALELGFEPILLELSEGTAALELLLLEESFIVEFGIVSVVVGAVELDVVGFTAVESFGLSLCEHAANPTTSNAPNNNLVIPKLLYDKSVYENDGENL